MRCILFFSLFVFSNLLSGCVTNGTTSYNNQENALPNASSAQGVNAANTTGQMMGPLR